jgi:hypothetical protein
MTAEPDARSVVTRSVVRGTRPFAGVYDVVKISTTAGATSAVVASRGLLSSAEVEPTRGRVRRGAGRLQHQTDDCEREHQRTHDSPPLETARYV